MKRERSIDLLKTVLVVEMIVGHVIQFLGNSNNKIQLSISVLGMLINFSGFMFCFGYASNIAYFPKEKQYVSKKLIKNTLNILMVFYASGIGYSLLIAKDLSLIKIFKILILSDIPGYSEFLAGFCILNVIILVFFNQFKLILSNKKILVGVLIISLISTAIPYKFISINQIGLFIGTENFACFPILQYLGYFLIGAYFQQTKTKYNLKYLILSGIGTSSLIMYTFVNKSLPERFPPTIYWIAGASFILYIHYLGCAYITNKYNLRKYIYFLGGNTLSVLLCSNLMIFTLKFLIPQVKLNLLFGVILSIMIMLICYIVIGRYKKILIKKCDKKKESLNHIIA